MNKIISILLIVAANDIIAGNNFVGDFIFMSLQEDDYNNFLVECKDNFIKIVGSDVMINQRNDKNHSNSLYTSEFIYYIVEGSRRVGLFSFTCRKTPGEKMVFSAEF